MNLENTLEGRLFGSWAQSSWSAICIFPSGARLDLAQLGSWVHFGRECAPKFLYHPTGHPTIRPSDHPTIRPTKDTRFTRVFPPNFWDFFKLSNRYFFAFIQVTTQFFSLPPIKKRKFPKKIEISFFCSTPKKSPLRVGQAGCSEDQSFLVLF